MTDLDAGTPADLTPPPLSHDCPEDDCDATFGTAAALGLHRFRVHGTPGKKRAKKARTSRARSPRQRGGTSGPARTAQTAIFRRELQAQLSDVAATLTVTMPRTSDALTEQASDLAAATENLVRQSRIGAAAVDVADNPDAAPAVEMIVAGFPVIVAYVGEVVIPFLRGRRSARQARRQGGQTAAEVTQAVDSAGRPLLLPDGAMAAVDRQGNLYRIDPAGNVEPSPVGHVDTTPLAVLDLDPEPDDSPTGDTEPEGPTGAAALRVDPADTDPTASGAFFAR